MHHLLRQAGGLPGHPLCHQCGCTGCLSTIKNSGGSCPIYRARIESTHRVYNNAPASAAAAAANPGLTTAMEPQQPALFTVLEEQDPAVGYEEWPGDVDDTVTPASSITVGIAPVASIEQERVVDIEIKVTVPEAGRTPVDVWTSAS